MDQKKCCLCILSGQSAISVSIVSLSKKARCWLCPSGERRSGRRTPPCCSVLRWCSALELSGQIPFQPAVMQTFLPPTGVGTSESQGQSSQGSNSSQERSERLLFTHTSSLCCETRWRGTRFCFRPFMHGDPGQLPGPIFTWPFFCLVHILSQGH